MIPVDLVYDPTTHTSTRGSMDVPHVTSILSAVGVSEDFDALLARGGRFAETVEHARLRGRAVHADCHAYDDGDLDWSTVDPRVAPYVHAWAEFRAAKKLEPVMRERQIYHPAYHYTGFLDGVFFDRRRGARVLVDIKTGNPASAAAHLQTAAYEAAHVDGVRFDLMADRGVSRDEARAIIKRERLGIDERWAVWLKPEQRVPYGVVDYTNSPVAYLDFQKFLACLTVYNEQPARRRT